MGQAFIPFPTAMMGKYPINPLAVSVFGLVMAINTMLFVALHAYILRNLIKPELMELKTHTSFGSPLLGYSHTLSALRPRGSACIWPL